MKKNLRSCMEQQDFGEPECLLDMNDYGLITAGGLTPDLRHKKSAHMSAAWSYAAATEVRIPPETFQYLNLPEGDSYTCTNLLDEAEQFPVVTLDSRTPFRTIIPAWKGKIIKLKRTARRPAHPRTAPPMMALM